MYIGHCNCFHLGMSEVVQLKHEQFWTFAVNKTIFLGRFKEVQLIVIIYLFVLMCCDTVWIQKCHHISQFYYIVLNSADQNSVNWLG